MSYHFLSSSVYQRSLAGRFSHFSGASDLHKFLISIPMTRRTGSTLLSRCALYLLTHHPIRKDTLRTLCSRNSHPRDGGTSTQLNRALLDQNTPNTNNQQLPVQLQMHCLCEIQNQYPKFCFDRPVLFECSNIRSV